MRDPDDLGEWGYPHQQYYFRLIVPRVLRASTMVVADSESTRLHISEHYGVPLEKIRIIHPAYDATVYGRGAFDNSPGGDRDAYVLYVGNLLPHKNLLRLRDAAGHLGHPPAPRGRGGRGAVR